MNSSQADLTKTAAGNRAPGLAAAAVFGSGSWQPAGSSILAAAGLLIWCLAWPGLLAIISRQCAGRSENRVIGS